MKKPFDQVRYNADDAAKHKVIDLFTSWNCDIRVNHDPYGIDLIGVDPLTGDTFGVEVEVKHGWTGAAFPWETIHYSARKLKFIDWIPQIHIATLNAEQTHVLLLDVHQYTDARMVRKQTSVTDAEWFLEFTLEHATINKI